MDYGTLEARLRVVERAVVGDALPGGQQGIAEVQRRQGEDILYLKRVLEHVTTQVDSIRRDRDEELSIRRGEQKMLRSLKTIIIAVLTIGGLGGTVLGSRILSALSELAK